MYSNRNFYSQRSNEEVSNICCHCSVTISCPTLCDCMDCSTPGFPVIHYLPEFVLTHIHWAIQPSHPLQPPSPPASTKYFTEVVRLELHEEGPGKFHQREEVGRALQKEGRAWDKWQMADTSVHSGDINFLWLSLRWEWGFVKEGNAKECSDYSTIALISHASKVMLKILQARLQQYMNCELPDVQAGFGKGSQTRDQVANIC